MICPRLKCKFINNGNCTKGIDSTKCTDYNPDECIFNIAGKGKCCAKTINNSDYCQEHLNRPCVACGKQSFHQCLWPAGENDEVCGELLCKDNNCFKEHLKKSHNEDGKLEVIR